MRVFLVVMALLLLSAFVQTQSQGSAAPIPKDQEELFPAPDFILRDAPHKEPKSGVQMGPGGQISIAQGVGTPTRINALSFSEDGRLLAAGKDFGRVALWNVQERKFLRALETGQGIVSAVALSPDGKTLATGGNKDDFSVKLWDVHSGELVRTLKEDEDYIQRLVFDPTGRWLGVTDNTGKAYVLEVANWTPVLRLVSTHVVRFSGDGNVLVTADQNEISIWNTTSWSKTRSIRRWQGFPILIAINTAADRIAVYQSWGVRIVRLSTGEAIEGLIDVLPKTSTGNPNFAEFSSDGSLLYASVADRLWVWDTRTNKVCGTPVMYSSAGALSTDRRWLAGSKDDSILSTKRTDGVWVWDTNHLRAACGMENPPKTD